MSLLEENLDKYNPDMVIAMMGLNDKSTSNYQPRSNFLHDSLVPHLLHSIQSLRVYKLTNFLWSSILVQRKKQKYDEASKTGYSTKEKTDSIKTASNDREVSGRYPYKQYLPIDSASLSVEEEVASLINQGKMYFKQREYKLAQQCFNKAIVLDPESEAAYIELARSYVFDSQFRQAQEAAAKVIEINPQNRWAYYDLGGYYQRDQPAKAESYYRKAIELNFGNDWMHTNLVWLYRSQGKLFDAEALLMEALVLYPNSYWINAALASVYKEMYRLELATEYENKLESLRANFYPSITVNNYHKLKEILDKRKIKLVCVQYPVWSIGPLMQIYKHQEGIIFVDNEKVFQDALKYGCYKDYFIDMYGGNFGHCTEKGNWLLAENIANAILKEAFGK